MNHSMDKKQEKDLCNKVNMLTTSNKDYKDIVKGLNEDIEELKHEVQLGKNATGAAVGCLIHLKRQLPEAQSMLNFKPWITFVLRGSYYRALDNDKYLSTIIKDEL